MTPAHLAGSPDAPSAALSDHSRFVQRLRRRYASELALLSPGDPSRETMTRAYESLRTEGHAPGAALRILRQLVMERLATLDCDEDAPLSTITCAMSELA